MIRVAIIGAGRMGRERARSARLLGAHIAIVCDADVERARTLAAETGAEGITEAGEIPWRSLDAAFVCTPPGCRGPVELAAIDSGIPIFSEKPIGLSAQQSLKIMTALDKRRVINAVGYMNRYRHSVLQARESIASTSPQGVVFHWLGTPYRVPWWLNRLESGGPVNEQCTHFIDLSRFFLGEVYSVSAVARPLSNEPDVEGTLAMTLVFRSGIVGVGLYGCESSRKQIAFEVFTTDGSVRLEGWDLQSNTTVQEDVFVKETDAFFRAIQQNNQALILSDFKSALETQCTVDAVRRAAESGRQEPVIYESEASAAA